MSANSLAATGATIDRVRSDRSFRDLLLFALTVSSGAVDAISFLALGKVFTAFMTGNLAFLGMGIAGSAGAPSSWAVLASMAGFAGGVYIGTIIVTPSRQPAAQQGEPGNSGRVAATEHTRSCDFAAASPRFRGDVARGRWPAWLQRDTRSPRRLGARHGNAERCGSMARCRRRVHHGRDRHLHLSGRQLRETPAERRRAAPIIWRACLSDCWRHGGRVSPDPCARLRPGVAVGHHHCGRRDGRQSFGYRDEAI